MQETVLHLPVVCKNLNADHTPLLDIYKAVDRLPDQEIVYRKRRTL